MRDDAVIYEKHFRDGWFDTGVRFLVWLDRGMSGVPLARVSRSDAYDPTDPLGDIVVIGNEPIEIAVEHRRGATSVRITRMKQVKVTG